jgi:excisionase family DNA binding protein
LRAEEVAEMLAMSRRQVYRWAAERRMPAIKFGPGAVRFDPEDIEAWLRQKKTP